MRQDDEGVKEGLQDLERIPKGNLEGLKNLQGLYLDLGNERLCYSWSTWPLDLVSNI